MHLKSRTDCITSIPMSPDERLSFKQLGARVAALRKAQGLTQAQLAASLDLAQQMVASYEVGRRRVPVSLLPALATTLAVSIEALLGHKEASPGKRGPTPQLQQKIERLSRLPKSQQKPLMQMLDGMLSQPGR